MASQDRPVAVTIPSDAEPWLSTALRELERAAVGDLGAIFLSERWRLADGESAGEEAVLLERRVGRGWERRRVLSRASTELTGTAGYDPPSVANGACHTTTVAVPGAVLGQPVAVGFSIALPAGVFLSAAVTAADVVTVTLANMSGSNKDVGAGTLRVIVLQGGE